MERHAMRRNPILSGYWADPYVFKDGEDYYLCPTKDSPEWANSKFYAFHSRNLTDWAGPVLLLDTADLSWAKSHAWAPSMTKVGDAFYFAFVANQQIGIARSMNPLGPFRDILGKPLIEAWDYDCQTIDPDLFIDDGQVFLLWGQGKCWIVPLAVGEFGAKFQGEPLCLSDQLYREKGQDPAVFDIGLFNEGAHLRKVGGRYLLTWSCYDTRDIRYCVKYAWSERILGPYIQPDENIIIQGEGPIQGTGHASIAEYEGDLYLFYHRMGERRSGYERETCMDRIIFIEGDRLIVKPTF